jgi:tRNA (guanine-N7-)-methyltransferase
VHFPAALNNEQALLLAQQETPFDFAAIFGNGNPVELEIGCGKGRFLMTEAQARPGVNFLGIEWAAKFARLCAHRASAMGLSNIRFLRDDAARTLKLCVPTGSLRGVYLLFPDPWPKAKQKKRRILQPEFLDQVARVVIPGGFLVMATDHVDYFNQMDALSAAHPRVEQVEKLVGAAARQGITNYEVKYRAEGRTIHNLTCRVR